MSAIFSIKDIQDDRMVVTATSDRMLVSASGDGVYLTRKDVATLHTALGTWLEENKRPLPREGAVRFPTGQVAVYDATIRGWMITGNERAWGDPEEIEKRFGTDWVEMVEA